MLSEEMMDSDEIFPITRIGCDDVHKPEFHEVTVGNGTNKIEIIGRYNKGGADGCTVIIVSGKINDTVCPNLVRDAMGQSIVDVFFENDAMTDDIAADMTLKIYQVNGVYDSQFDKVGSEVRGDSVVDELDNLFGDVQYVDSEETYDTYCRNYDEKPKDLYGINIMFHGIPFQLEGTV